MTIRPTAAVGDALRAAFPRVIFALNSADKLTVRWAGGPDTPTVARAVAKALGVAESAVTERVTFDHLPSLLDTAAAVHTAWQYECDVVTHNGPDLASRTVTRAQDSPARTDVDAAESDFLRAVCELSGINETEYNDRVVTGGQEVLTRQLAAVFASSGTHIAAACGYDR